MAQYLQQFESMISPQVMIGLGAFGILSSIPQMKFFGSFGMGIPVLEEYLGGWNHASSTGDPASMDGQNAWWMGGSGRNSPYGSVPGQVVPVLIGDKNWMCHAGLGFGFGWGTGCTTVTEGTSFLGNFPLVPFAALVLWGILRLYPSIFGLL